MEGGEWFYGRDRCICNAGGHAFRIEKAFKKNNV